MTQSVPYIRLNYSGFFHLYMRFIVRSVHQIVQAIFLLPNVHCIIADCASVVAISTVTDSDDRGIVNSGSDSDDGVVVKP